MITKCLKCGGKTVKKSITTENWWGEKLTFVENVPAYVCDTCGEQYFEPEVCEELERLSLILLHEEETSCPPGNTEGAVLLTSTKK